MENNIFYMHNHSEYSNLRMLDCINKLTDLIDYCANLGAKGLALTDHESLSGHIKALRYVKECKEKGKLPKDFVLGLGNEIYLITGDGSDRAYYHFILIAKDEIGHRQLRELSSLAWEYSTRTGLVERVPTSKEMLKDIVSKDKGHLIATTACIGGEVGRTILELEVLSTSEEEEKEIAKDRLENFIDFCLDLFGDDFYFEVQPNDQPAQIVVNETLKKWSKALGVKAIIATDTHYLRKEDRELHANYLKSRYSSDRELEDFYTTTYMMPVGEIHSYLDEYLGSDFVDECIENTIRVSEKITEYDLYHTQEVPKTKIPEFTIQNIFKDMYKECPYIEKFANSENIEDRYFLYLVEKGWINKANGKNATKKEYEIACKRINEEMEAIWETSLHIKDTVSAYYLSAREIIAMMWDSVGYGGNSLVGPGRGSVACFYTSYLLDIHEIDSIKNNLWSPRHLHSSRPEMPDIDIDTEKSKRALILEATKNKFGRDKVLNICTFKTEGAKSALLTSCRALNIDNDVGQYLASMISVNRGQNTSLQEMVYGNEEKELKPNTEFIRECNKYPKLLNMALSIEGLVCGRSIHASGVIIFTDKYTVRNCCMKAPNGQLTTQYSMADSEYCGGLKYDFLTITNLDAMRQCLELLIKYGYIKKEKTLKETFMKHFSPRVLDYDSKKMWEMASNGDIVNLFQFMTPVGLNAIKKIQPRNLVELGVSNAIMRLAPEHSHITPLDQYVLYKKDISKWYECMNKYALTNEEIKILEKHLLKVSGSCSTQEEVMLLSMDSKISDFTMSEANKLRKGIGKKNKKLQEECKEKFFIKGREKGTSINLLNYVWNECIVPQLGYSFSSPHIVAYSTIALQEMNMAFKYPIIYWNTANLIVDSGSLEEVDRQTTQYGKVATAIANMQAKNINIELPLIEKSSAEFIPDEKNNTIIYSLKAISGIGDETVKTIVENRPYNNFEDFCIKNVETGLIKKSTMIQLIKAGCFSKLVTTDRKELIEEYVCRYEFKEVNKLTMAHLDKLIAYGLLSEEDKILYKMNIFSKYVLDDKNVHDTKNQDKKFKDILYTLPSECKKFFEDNFTENSIIKVIGEDYIISKRLFSKELNSRLSSLKEKLKSADLLKKYNGKLLKQMVGEFIDEKDTISKFEMDSLCFYYTKHELENIDEEKYGVVNFFDEPPTPKAYDTYCRYIDGEKRYFPKFKIVRLAGTVLDKDDIRNTINLLTKYGVVTCKFYEGQYSFYNKQISELDEESGKKKILDASWFKRGTKLLISGYRIGEDFKVHRYKDSVFLHSVNRIRAYDGKDYIEIDTERG